MSIDIVPNSFSAWIDRQPGAGRPAIVIGQVRAAPNAAPRLVKASPQGINPDILLLDLVAADDASQDGATIQDVRFDERPAQRDYTEAQIRNGSTSFTIPVGRTD